MSTREAEAGRSVSVTSAWCTERVLGLLQMRREPLSPNKTEIVQKKGSPPRESIYYQKLTNSRLYLFAGPSVPARDWLQNHHLHKVKCKDAANLFAVHSRTAGGVLCSPPCLHHP